MTDTDSSTRSFFLPEIENNFEEDSVCYISSFSGPRSSTKEPPPFWTLSHTWPLETLDSYGFSYTCTYIIVEESIIQFLMSSLNVFHLFR